MQVKFGLRRHACAEALAVEDREVFNLPVRMLVSFRLDQLLEPRHSRLEIFVGVVGAQSSINESMPY